MSNTLSALLWLASSDTGRWTDRASTCCCDENQTGKLLFEILVKNNNKKNKQNSTAMASKGCLRQQQI